MGVRRIRGKGVLYSGRLIEGGRCRESFGPPMREVRMRFLLVDDSSTMRKIQRRTLEKLGFGDVLEAEDGNQGLAQVESGKPDIVITDWNMPNLDGLSFVKQLRAGGHTVPIIMVTTEAEKSKVVEAIKAGINDYLIKPFTPDALAAKIRRVTE